MPSWEEIANEVVPPEVNITGLATGAQRPIARSQWQRRFERPEGELKVIPCPACPADVALEIALGGEEKVCARRGSHLEIARAAAEYDAPFADLGTKVEAALQSPRFLALSNARLRDLVLMDIETTGVSATAPLFLIGILRFDESKPLLEFFLARDYGEEPAAIAAFHQRARGKRLVTFNGKSFDWPYIRRRSERLKVPYGDPPAHLDMLHEARKLWKGRFPDCRLQTLERFLCKRARQGDVPSHRIPMEYERFIERRRNNMEAASLLAPIIHHNALDLLTLAEILCLAHDA
jgi:uncharacterized protein YprB with RNaseH-like and TPR domain